MQESELSQNNQQQTDPAQTIVPAAAVQNEFPKQNNFIVILLSILLLLSVSIAGFFAYQTQILVKELTLLKNFSNPIAQAITEQTTEPLTTTDPTVNWKTYNDEENGYLFKYPSTWKIVDLGTGSKYKDIYNAGYLLYKSDPTVECGGSVGMGGGGPCDNSASIQFSVGNITSPIEDFDQSYWGRGFVIKNKTNTVIDGVPVVMAYSGDKIPEATIFKVSDTKQVYVTTEFFEDKSKSVSLYNKDTVAEINQILSTFKFTN